MSALCISCDTVLMVSDNATRFRTVKMGDQMHISLQTETDEDTDRLFNKIPGYGKTTMPLDKHFWGARFGMFVDKSGVQWMPNQELNQNDLAGQSASNWLCYK